MSQSDLAIRIQDLGKSYTIVHGAMKRVTFGDAMMQRLRRPFHRPSMEIFWALKDISLDINKGEVVGIIGRNGAGKSTLLKILSRITEPTTGRIEVFGRVGSLLEVGTGFHPELTGRENIYLNGAILGMSRAEIRKQFDAIVEFAEVEKFLDTPVKRYSSGMYVRLAFAVAAHLNPEILVVDEVLAVGDAEFQKKCLGKMGEVAKSGRTVLFVSHNMGAIDNLCSSALVLERGLFKYHGPTGEAINQYLTGMSGQQASADINDHRPRWAKPLITQVRAIDSTGQTRERYPMGGNLEFEMSFRTLSGGELQNPMMSVVINHATFGIVANVSSHLVNFRSDGPYQAATMRCRILHCPLLPGHYFADIWLGDGQENFDCIARYVSFEIELADVYGTGRPPWADGVVFLKPEFAITPIPA